MAILITIIGFGFMIFIHELGHFIAAKRFGVLVHEFAIGMGPKIFSFEKGETVYSLRAFPIGGFVKLEGENELEESDDLRSFSNLKPLKRIIILLAGAFMNVLFGFVIFSIINLNVGVTSSIVADIPDELAASQVTFKEGDEIIRLNNTRTHSYEDVSLFMSRYDKDVIDVTLKRNGKTIEIEDAPLIKTETGYKLGVIFAPQKASVIKSAEFAVYDTIHISKAVLFAVVDIISGKTGINSLSGPVEIVSTVGAVASQQNEYTFLNILLLFAMITVNLGIFNLLPFPALDGGSILFALYELITRKKVKSEIVGYAGLIGFALLMLLAIYVTAGDIMDLIR